MISASASGSQPARGGSRTAAPCRPMRTCLSAVSTLPGRYSTFAELIRACDRRRDRADACVKIQHAVAFGGREHVQRSLIKDEHLLVVRLHERLVANAKRHAPELERYRIVQQNLVRQQLRNSARQLRLRPVRDAATKAQPPQQPGPARLHGQEEILDTANAQL